MLTWDQLKHIRNRKTKGHTPSWFKKLEVRVLKENSSREVQDSFKVSGPNREAIKIQSQDISKDRRKKEWVLFKRKESFHIGKIVRKTEKLIIAEHWSCTSHSAVYSVFTKCNRCKIGSSSNNECLVNIRCKEWCQLIKIRKKVKTK